MIDCPVPSIPKLGTHCVYTPQQFQVWTSILIVLSMLREIVRMPDTAQEHRNHVASIYLGTRKLDFDAYQFSYHPGKDFTVCDMKSCHSKEIVSQLE